MLQITSERPGQFMRTVKIRGENYQGVDTFFLISWADYKTTTNEKTTIHRRQFGH